MKRKTVVLIGAGVVVLGAGGFAASKRGPKPTVVEVSTVSREDIQAKVTANGKVQAKKKVEISATIPGQITHLAVKEGDLVKKDQVLAHIESERYEAGTRMSEAAVQSALAELDRAQADLDVSRLQLDRMKKMMADKLVSAQTYDQADAEVKMKAANVEAARRRVTQLQAQHDSNRDDLRKTTVFAPMSGVVTSLPKEEGEVVIGAQSFSPTVIMTVADLSVMECEIMVDETDIRNLTLGQPAQVRVDALEGVKIEGEVTEIGSSAIVRGSTAGGATNPAQTGANTGNQAKDFKVTITLKDPPANLRPQMNATADITTAKRANVLAAPIQAVVVRQVDAQGKPIDPEATPSPTAADANTVVKTAKAKLDERDGVFVITSNKAAFRPVKTGILGETDVEILDGLKEGDEIVTGSYKTLRTLKDGASLKVELPKKTS